jgi:hypothetical protein
LAPTITKAEVEAMCKRSERWLNCNIILSVRFSFFYLDWFFCLVP